MTLSSKNITLIGMPGCGKSTVGVVLAKNMGFQFLDSDLLIQQQENKRLFEIITESGLEQFLRIEDQVNASIQAQKTIIATGGSVIYGKNAMQHLAAISTILYLELPFFELEKRLGDLNQRGVAIKKGETLLDLYDARTPLYEKYADITIHCQNKSIREIVHDITQTKR
jgi:shikimate kinase